MPLWLVNLHFPAMSPKVSINQEPVTLALCLGLGQTQHTKSLSPVATMKCCTKHISVHYTLKKCIISFKKYTLKKYNIIKCMVRRVISSLIGHLHDVRHFTTTTRILQGFAFLCKLNLTGITKFKYETKTVMNSCLSSKNMSLCKLSIHAAFKVIP